MKWLIRLTSRLVNAYRLSSSRRHRRNVQYSRKLLKKLAAFQHNGAALNYLKKIDPYVFEDLALTLFEQRGLFVLRSTRYSGDGGIDGRFYWPGRGWYAIQCKRYGKKIAASHAQAFAQLCREQFSGGVFIHTGVTGDSSEEALTSPSLCILSGSDLAQCARNPQEDLLERLTERQERTLMKKKQTI